jgi:type IV pilus assembly protein PilV
MGAEVKNGTYNAGGLVGVVGCVLHNNNSVLVAISWEGREETSDGAVNSNTADIGFGQNCGTSSNKRRQIVVNGFVY